MTLHNRTSSTNEAKYTPPSPSFSRRTMGWAVHLYTSLGLPINLFSLWALTEGDGRLFFCLNLLAVLIDATDGFLARKLDIKSLIPEFNGSKLDDLIDYLTFTFLPVAALPYHNLMPPEYSWCLALILISSAYGFCQTQAKTEEAFVGFPSYWNLVVYYFYLLQPPLWLTMTFILLFSLMTFIPIHFIYPTRTKMWMKLTLLGSVLYVLTLIYSVFGIEEQRLLAGYLSLIYVGYYWVASLIHHLRIHREPKHE